MRISPEDVTLYSRCPRLYYEKKYNLVKPPLSVIESTLRDSIIEAEEKSLLKDSYLTPLKLHRVWDRLWWPRATENKMSMKEAERDALQAAFKLADYCNYDFTDFAFPTITTNAKAEIALNSSSVFCAEMDIIKISIDNNRKNMILIDLSRKGYDQKKVMLDPGIRALASAFYAGEGETITYINIDLDEKHKKLKVLSANFRPEDIEQARKMLYHLETGMRKQINYYNPYSCGDCKLCQDFSFLMKENSPLK